jgi:hypothetical protein
MVANRSSSARWRLDRIPAQAWATGALGALAVVLAFNASAPAAVLMLLGAVAAFLTVREARRFVIAPRDDDTPDLIGLDAMAPLLDGLPDPALLVDEHGRIVSSNAAARRLGSRCTSTACRSCATSCTRASSPRASPVPA